MPRETVGIRLSKYKRRLRLMQMIGLALLALVTMFTAVKLGDSGGTHSFVLLIGTLFLTFIIFAGAALAGSRGNFEFQADLLERYLTKNQTSGEESGFDEKVSIEVAAEKYSNEKLNKEWPKRSEFFFRFSLIFTFISAFLLLLYIWLSFLTYSSKPKIPEVTPKTLGTKTIQNLSSGEIQDTFTKIKEEIKKVNINADNDRQETKNALNEIKQETNDTIKIAEKINNEARFILTEIKNLLIELYQVVKPTQNKELPKEKSTQEQISQIGIVYFDSGETQLNENGKIEVQKIAKIIKNNTFEEIKVIGHTDSVNDKTKNKILSEKRAETVKNYLVQNGIPAQKIITQGQGEKDLAISTPNGTNEPKNRRVDVILVKSIL